MLPDEYLQPRPPTPRRTLQITDLALAAPSP